MDFISLHPRLAGVHLLATVDASTYAEDDGNTTDDDHPISWCHRCDGGRSWYTGMGHTRPRTPRRRPEAPARRPHAGRPGARDHRLGQLRVVPAGLHEGLHGHAGRAFRRL